MPDQERRDVEAMLDLIDFTGQGIAPAAARGGKAALAGSAAVAPATIPGAAPGTPAAKGGGAHLSLEAKRKVQELLGMAAQAHQQGRTARLKQILEQVLEIDQENDQALLNLGIIHRDEKENARAEMMFRRAIRSNPENITAYHALGELLFNVKHVLTAVKTYEMGLKRAPHHMAMLVNLMRARIMLRHYRDVEDVARRILAIEENEADVLCYLGWAIWRQRKAGNEALAAVDKALTVNPDHLRAMVVKERILTERDDPSLGALRAQLLERARTGTGADIRSLNEMFLWSDAISEATQYINEYILAHPDDAEAEGILIQAIMFDGDFVGAHRIIERMAKMFPERAQLQTSHCLNMFRLGRFDEAMAIMECRWGRDQAGDKLNFPCPEWKGEEIRDGKLVIYAEQGVGDHIMYAGHMIPVRRRANHIAFEVSPRQATLFRRSFPDFEIIERSSLPPGWRMEEVRAKIAAADVAYVMGEDYLNLPGREGFLVPDPQLLSKLRKKYQARFPGKLLVGISWRSGNRDSSAIRSLELENWLPILRNANCGFVSLQYGDVSRDIEEMKSEFGIDVLFDPTIEPMGNMDPFTAQVAAMDIVVSVDNSTIHYAAALGKPTWAMLPINSDWRWLVEGEKSIWYDSLRLLRQHKGDSWEQMVEKVGGMLADVDAAELHAAHVAMLKRCAETLQKYGRTSETEDYCRMLLEEDAHKDLALHGIAISAMNVGKPQDAVAILARALELAPDQPALRAELAVALDAAGESERAERLARDTLRQYGDSEEALIAMGRILSRQERFDEATDFYARVLRGSPDNIPCRVQLARLMDAQGESALARSNYAKALQFAPTSAIAHQGNAETALRHGDWETGWRHFGWRFGLRPGLLPRHLETIDPKNYPAPWTGGHLKRKRLFLRAERSLAEQLLFAPLLAEAAEEARYVLAECDPAVIPLLQPLFPKVEFAAAGALTPKDLVDKRIQIQSSLGDLAARYRAGPAEFAAALPFKVAVDDAMARQLSAEYREVMPGRRLIGLSWTGGDRSLKSRLTDWLPLFDAVGIGVVAIQQNPAQEHLDELAASGRDMIVDARAQAGLAAAAAQIAALDGVIAVDDVTAHLAAQLGVRVVKPVQQADNWYWGAPEAPQLWYKNVTTLFHEGGGNAADLIARTIGAALAEA
jgi:tetratricopeptide (TPR) repeat protein